jgi:hypothetical protein
LRAIRPEPAMVIAVINSDRARVRAVTRHMNEDRMRMATAALRLCPSRRATSMDVLTGHNGEAMAVTSVAIWKLQNKVQLALSGGLLSDNIARWRERWQGGRYSVRFGAIALMYPRFRLRASVFAVGDRDRALDAVAR